MCMITLGQNASPVWALTFSSIKWERAHLSRRFARRPDVPKELNEREYSGGAIVITVDGSPPSSLPSSRVLASPWGAFVGITKGPSSGGREGSAGLGTWGLYYEN